MNTVVAEPLIPPAGMACDIGILVPGEPSLSVGYEVFAPPVGVAPVAVMFCVPGGGLAQGYYSLEANGAPEYHWARAMAGRGMVVVTVDPLGVGASTQPADGYVLSLNLLATAYALAVAAIRTNLERGATPSAPSCRDLPVIGLGSSMGGAIVLLSQAVHRPHDAIVLLGVHPAGLAEGLSERIGALAAEPQRIAADLASLLQADGRASYARIRAAGTTSHVFAGGDPRAVTAMKAVLAPLPTLAGVWATIPGALVEAAAAVAAPVFLGFGEHDFWPAPQAAAGYFTACPHLTLTVLPETGHTHLVFPSVVELQWKVACWAVGLFTSAR